MALDTWVLEIVLACLMTLALQAARARGMLGRKLALPFVKVEIRQGAEPPPRGAAPPPPLARTQPPPPHVTLSATKATDLFLEWMAEAWSERYLSAAQVDESWRAFARNRGLYLISCGLIRGEMTARGLCCGMRRLSAPELLHIRHALGRDRSVVYKRPSQQELATAKERASHFNDTQLPVDNWLLVGSEPARNRHMAGSRPASAKGRIKKHKLTPRQAVSGDYQSLREAA